MKFRLVNSDYDYPIKYINKLKEAGFILTDELYGEKLNAYIDINVSDQFKLLSKLCKQDLVLNFVDEDSNKDNIIIIYDGWLE